MWEVNTHLENSLDLRDSAVAAARYLTMSGVPPAAGAYGDFNSAAYPGATGAYGAAPSHAPPAAWPGTAQVYGAPTQPTYAAYPPYGHAAPQAGPYGAHAATQYDTSTGEELRTVFITGFPMGACVCSGAAGWDLRSTGRHPRQSA